LGREVGGGRYIVIKEMMIKGLAIDIF